MAKLAPKSFVFPYVSDDFMEQMDADEVIFEKLCKASEKVNVDKGEVIGLVVSFPIADGYASYLVVNEKPLTLQHIPVRDRYQADYCTIRGLRKEDVLARERADRAFRKSINDIKRKVK